MYNESRVVAQPDLVDHILAMISEGSDGPISTLRACALVSTMWRRFAYPHMFKRMQLTVRAGRTNTSFLVSNGHIYHSAVQLEDQRLYEGQWRTTARSIAEITQFFASSPFICGCVRWLYLQTLPAMRPLKAETLYGLLRPLPRLRHVELQNVTLKYPRKTTLPGQLPAVDFLQICTEDLRRSRDRLVSPEELFALVELFSDVKHLSLRNIPMASQPEVHCHGLFPAVQSLSVVNSPLAALLRTLSQVPLESLHTVDFSRLHISTVDDVSGFLRILGPVLRDIILGKLSADLHEGTLDHFVAAYSKLDLLPCVNLESITYGVMVFSLAIEEQLGQPAWHLEIKDGTIAADSIARVAPTWTRVIKLRIAHAGPASWPSSDRALPWTEFEDVLLNRVDRGLQSVLIDWVEPLIGTEQAKARMRSYLPRLFAKGKVAFVEY